jgi:hypothetical protein
VRQCAIPGCDRPATRGRRGLCRKHSARVRRTGVELTRDELAEHEVAVADLLHWATDGEALTTAAERESEAVA